MRDIVPDQNKSYLEEGVDYCGESASVFAHLKQCHFLDILCFLKLLASSKLLGAVFK